MLQVRTNFFIAQKLEDLPNLRFVDKLYLDVETKRVFDNKKLGGLYPWKGDKVCGIGLTADDEKRIWYVPVRHKGDGNLPIEPVMKWLTGIFKTAKSWINHNVKFDATMLIVGDGVDADAQFPLSGLELVCTIVLAKLHNSDRLAYGLKPLCKEILGYDTGSLDRVQAFLESIGSKSYADVPIDILGEYCCDDIQMNRQLYHYLKNDLPESLNRIWGIERKLTSVLLDMELRGLCIDPTECKKEAVKSLRKMISSSTKITELTEVEFTNSNDCIYDIFVNQLDLPVLATIKEKQGREWIDTRRPSFDKDAMALYLVHPMVTGNPKIQEIVKNVSTYRTESTYNGLFLENFLTLNVDGIVHPNYNQIVRTGRMSCSNPNSQQQNKRSKKLVHPHPGRGFISNDYSQIEFRLIVHYIKDQAAIAAYREDPNTDFHQWVAELLGGIDRPSGKTLNFGMSYGAGKARVTAGLMANEIIINKIAPIIHELVASGQLDPKLQDKKFKDLCKTYAYDAYQRYHERLPGIKLTSRRAMNNAKLRGYVFTAYGRRRHLDENFCHKAFNTVIQGTAADIMKDRINALAPRYNAESRSLNIDIAANVHDEALNEAPIEQIYDKKIHDHICGILQKPEIDFRIPIITGLGVSPNNWSEAADKEIVRNSEGDLIAGKIR